MKSYYDKLAQVAHAHHPCSCGLDLLAFWQLFVSRLFPRQGLSPQGQRRGKGRIASSDPEQPLAQAAAAPTPEDRDLASAVLIATLVIPPNETSEKENLFSAQNEVHFDSILFLTASGQPPLGEPLGLQARDPKPRKAAEWSASSSQQHNTTLD
jgi:hypothetical protein